jgi:hypothetical protein
MDRNDGPRPAPNEVDELLRQLLDDDPHQHLAYEQLEDLIDGRLAPEAHAAVQQHLSACETCRANEAHLRDFAAQVRVDEPPATVTAATPTPRTWWTPALGIAAALALIVWAASRTGNQLPAPIEDPPVAVITPTPMPLLPLDKPDVRLGSGAIAWRGAASENAYLADLKAPLDAYRTGNYGESDRLFAELAPRYPSAFEIHFYQGISRLFLDDARGASVALAEAERIATTTVATDSTLFTDIVWYRAVADQRAGDLDAASRHLRRLCDTPGTRQAQSCGALAASEARPPK